VIKIRKSDESFKRALMKTVDSLKSVMRKRSGRKADHHRRDPMLNYSPTWEEMEMTVA
jgi:hypothetical protein